jgi:hypothetical protein
MFRYHKQFTHGISSITGSKFADPEKIRAVWSVPLAERFAAQAFPINLIVEAYCNVCNSWYTLNRYRKKFTHSFANSQQMANSIKQAGVLFPPETQGTLSVEGYFQDSQLVVPEGVKIPEAVLKEVNELKTDFKSSNWWKHCHKCHPSSSL